MLKDKIHFLSESFFDPVGRVFFLRDRVFRAIEADYVQATLDFLKSPLFHELQKRKWLVKTWVSHDVQVNGYDLILEHERMKCISPSIWTFSQLKDAILFNMQIDNLCQEYGTRLRDARYSNITFIEGRPIFVDFGSFVGNLECYLEKDFYLLVYPPLYWYSKREFMLSRIWQEKALDYYRTNQVAPMKVIEDSMFYKNLYSHKVKYYDIHIRQKYPHFKIYTNCGIEIFRGINLIARRLLGKDSIWKLFKYEAIYKYPQTDFIVKIKSPYLLTDNYTYPEEHLDTIQFSRSMPNDTNLKSIMLYGNFSYENIKEIRSQFIGEIIIVSPDYIYTDRLYLKAKEDNININVVCCNILTETSDIILKELSVDILIINNFLITLSFATANSAYKVVSQCHRLGKYLYVGNREFIEGLLSKGFYNHYKNTKYENLFESI